MNKYYIIEEEWVGPHDEQHDDAHTYIITTDTPVTNMSREKRTEGWLGTSSNWSAHAHGEFDSVEAAVAKVEELLEGDYRKDEDTNPGEVAVYRVGKYQPWGRDATRDWISTAPDKVPADTTDAQIEEWADNCVDNGRSNLQIELDREAVVEWYEEQREEARIEEKITEIIEAKEAAGADAYLWLNGTSGDCILWPNEESSENDDGANALKRWTLTQEEVEALEDADTESDTIIIDGRN
jgi:hypothetical protein